MDYFHSKELLAIQISNSSNTEIDKKVSNLLWVAYLWGHHDALKSMEFKTESESDKDLEEIKRTNKSFLMWPPDCGSQS